MAAVKELLRAEADGALGFGDYTLSSKTKLDGFEFQGDVYKRQCWPRGRWTVKRTGAKTSVFSDPF